MAQTPAEIITALIAGENQFYEQTHGKLSGAGDWNSDNPFESTGDLGANLRMLRGVVDARFDGIWSQEIVFNILRAFWTSFRWDKDYQPINPRQAEIDAAAAEAKAKADRAEREAKFRTGLVQPKTEWDIEYKKEEKPVKAAYVPPTVADTTLPPTPPAVPIVNTEEDLRRLPNLRQLMTGPHQRAFKKRMDAIVARANAERQRAAVALAGE